VSDITCTKAPDLYGSSSFLPRSTVGATLVEVLDDYADELAEAGGRLYLSG
jgi:hypothetical protein